MERYDKYINTGVSWMPRIPSHWKHVQFRGLFKITKRIAGRTGLDVLAVTQRGIKVKDVESNEGQIAADYSNYQIVEPGDFAMNHMDLITGFVGISPQYGVTSPDYRVFKNISPLASSQFYLYIFELCYKQQIFYGLGHGVSNKGRWRLPAPIQNRFEIPLPPLAEQHRIVAKIEELLPKVEEYGKAQDALNKLNAELPERLKKSILQEAIEGRLVPQDPNDEPASVLLAQIRKEKEQLVKEGKLKKKDLIETPISDDEIPFEIPDSWEWCRIKQLFETTSGGTPEKGHPEYYGGEIPWVKVGDLIKKNIDKTEECISEEGLNHSSAKLFPKGTILVAMYCNDAIGKSSIIESPMTTNQAICGLFPNPSVSTDYIYYAIQANRTELQEKAAGGAQKNINQKIVNDMLIPLPPLVEQHRIVEKLEQLLGEIDKLKN